MSWVAWFNSNVPESSSIAQMGVCLKHKLSILTSFGPDNLVGVASQKWAWSENFRAFFILHYVPASSHELGNFATGTGPSLQTHTTIVVLLHLWIQAS